MYDVFDRQENTGLKQGVYFPGVGENKPVFYKNKMRNESSQLSYMKVPDAPDPKLGSAASNPYKTYRDPHPDGSAITFEAALRRRQYAKKCLDGRRDNLK